MKTKVVHCLLKPIYLLEKIQKITMQILKRMKTILSKLKQTSKMNQYLAKQISNEALVKKFKKLNKKDSFVVFC
jgi:hypothetical protein